MDLGQVDLNLLYTLRTFVELGSVGRAAHALGRSQPAISARLHQLEEELGVSLLERSGRRLRLTPIGRVIDAEARVVLAGLHRIVDEARASKDRPIGRLRVGALPTVSAYLLAPRIARFMRAYPAVEVEIVHGLVDGQLRALEAGDLDVVVSVGEGNWRRLLVTTLGHTTPALVLPKAGGKVPRGRVSNRRLAAMKLIRFGRINDPFFDAVEGFLEEQGLDDRAVLRVPHIQTIKGLVASGAGVSILPDYTVVEPELVTRPLEGLRFSHPIWLAVRPSAAEVPAIQRFREACAGLGGRRRKA